MFARLLRTNKRVVKIKIEGPIDTKLQQHFIANFPKIDPQRTQALIVIINSYGGSLSVAKNIAASLQLIQKQSVPVYAFAEQFCLNSANLILTSATQCYAHNLSVIGDFGYAMQYYSTKQLNQKHNIGFESIGNTKQIDIFLDAYQVNDVPKCQKIVQDLANQLKRQVIANRQNRLRAKNKQNSEYRWMQGGSLRPELAMEMGLIDGLHSQTEFIQQRLKGLKVVNKMKVPESFAKYWRMLFKMFKQSQSNSSFCV